MIFLSYTTKKKHSFINRATFTLPYIHYQRLEEALLHDNSGSIRVVKRLYDGIKWLFKDAKSLHTPYNNRITD